MTNPDQLRNLFRIATTSAPFIRVEESINDVLGNISIFFVLLSFTLVLHVSYKAYKIFITEKGRGL
jgi:hypothetical protein